MAGIPALIGLISGAFPTVAEYFNRYQDNKHELAILDLQYKHYKADREDRMDLAAYEMQGDTYKATLSHDNISGSYKPFTLWGKFWFDQVAIWRASMRPAIVTCLLGVYVLVKVCQLYVALGDGSFNALAAASVVITLWAYEDWAMLELGVSWYFAGRAMEKKFGAASV